MKVKSSSALFRASTKGFYTQTTQSGNYKLNSRGYFSLNRLFGKWVFLEIDGNAMTGLGDCSQFLAPTINLFYC